MSTATESIEFNELHPIVYSPTPNDIPTPVLPPTKNSLEISQRQGGLPSSNIFTTSNFSNHELESPSPASLPTGLSPSKLRITFAIFQPSMVNFFGSFTTGAVTVALPAIAQSLAIPRSLYLWPASVYGLTSGSLLLIAGSIADLIGPRDVELVGIFLLGVFTLAGGFARSGIQMVVFRALQGTAMAMHLPASIALVAAGVPEGRARNFGFACLGLSQIMGYSVGLVASGVLVDHAGWRSAFFLSGSGLLFSAGIAFWVLPKVESRSDAIGENLWRLLRREVDWIGGFLASGGMAIFAYVLAILSADLSAFKQPVTAVLFSISIVLLIAFPFWMHRREQAGQPALVPNSLWNNIAFTTTCIMVALSYGVLSSMELFSSLYFQEIQNKTALTTSLYLLPNLIVGGGISVNIGLFVHRIPARGLVAISSLLCSFAPLFMACVNPTWSYWYLEFWAQVFTPMSADVLFTVGLIIVSSNFPQKTQALAGAVFNTVACFGQSFGIGICQVVALGVVGPPGNREGGGGHGGALDGVNDDKALSGYRAAFWTMFAMMIACGSTAVYGLRKAGKVGVKKE